MNLHNRMNELRSCIKQCALAKAIETGRSIRDVEDELVELLITRAKEVKS